MDGICRQVSELIVCGTTRSDIHSYRIHYSEVYDDDQFQYRHVILPKPLLRMLPKSYFNQDDSGTLRLLSEQEWRGMGVTQSLGWVHYEVHSTFHWYSNSHIKILTTLRQPQNLMFYSFDVIRISSLRWPHKMQSLHASRDE